MERQVEEFRTTRETDIALKLDLDGTGRYEIHTGVGFFDHMLAGFARHGLFDLDVTVGGDLEWMTTIRWRIRELCWERPSGRRWEIRRASAGTEAAFFPWMRPWCSARWIWADGPTFPLKENFPRSGWAIWGSEMVREFFYAVSYTCGMNLHMKILSGFNSHHMAEALFKAFAKALDMASLLDTRITDVLSTKGKPGIRSENT